MLFEDEMKAESKMMRFPLILSLVLSIVFPVCFYYFTEGASVRDVVISAVFFFLCFLLSLYVFLYGLNYHLIVGTDKIILKTLFGKKDINIDSVNSFRFIRFYKSGFGQFVVRYGDRKSVKISTKHVPEFVNLLKNAGAEEENG